MGPERGRGGGGILLGHGSRGHGRPCHCGGFRGDPGLLGGKPVRESYYVLGGAPHGRVQD